MPDPDRLRVALGAIDEANRSDPSIVTIRERTGPKEVLHAELVSEWVAKLRPDRNEALQLAARGHHLRRWTIPRATYPEGRAGYLRWRRALQDQHAREIGELLVGCGYDASTIERVQALVRKESFNHTPRDPDLQALEDALCLVFLETQFADIAARLSSETLAGVIVKTTAKMSTSGLALIADVPLGSGLRALIDEAFARDAVQRYLDGLRSHDWPAVAATLADDVERMGPYRDECRGRDEYARFLESTISALSGYELSVHRMVASGGTVVVELRETVDDGDARLATDETVVFDVTDGLITKVAVYLQTSH